MLSLGLITQSKVKAESFTVTLTSNIPVATPQTSVTASGFLTLTSPLSTATGTQAWLTFPGDELIIGIKPFADNRYPIFSYPGDIVGNYFATLEVHFTNTQGVDGDLASSANLYLPGPSSTPPTNPTPPPPPM